MPSAASEAASGYYGFSVSCTLSSSGYTDRNRAAEDRRVVADGVHCRWQPGIHGYPYPDPPCVRPIENDGRCIFHLPKPAIETIARHSVDELRGAFALQRKFDTALIRLFIAMDRDSSLGFLDFRGFQFFTAEFSSAIFGRRAAFDGASFGSRTSFEKATFTEGASFSGAQLDQWCSFRGATFSKAVGFDDAKMGEGCSFDGAKFLGEASFWSAEFGRRCSFREAAFSDKCTFVSVEFGDSCSISSVEFSSGAQFYGAKFGDDCTLFESSFMGWCSFQAATFGKRCSFYQVTFTAAFTKGDRRRGLTGCEG